ncbi:MAG: dolichyl-phosphate-mannose--protein mannosyltransferase [Candidatus Nanopelagicales bacterium]
MTSPAVVLPDPIAEAAAEPAPTPVAEDRAEQAPATDRLYRPFPSHGWRGWVGPLVVTIIAAVLRLHELGRPHAIVFDETYYVKDGLSLFRFGYEREAIEGADKVLLAHTGGIDTLDIWKDNASYVVHPPVGKWIIGAGQWLFGPTPFGWRFGVCVLGILSVLLVARIVRRLTRSDVIGTLAGLLLALDGLHITMSRTALLDMSLQFFVVIAFGCLLLDRDAVRRRADAWRTLWDGAPVRFGPGFGPRPWRIAAGVSLGLACGVKWSGLWFVAFFGILTVLWDWQLRRALGVRRPALAMLLRDGLPAFLSLVVLAFVVYIGTWAGWLLHAGGYDRDWAASHPATGMLGLVPDTLRSLAEYHRAAWAFHVGLTTEHAYRSSAWSWPLMTRPTSFFYDSPTGCGAEKCSAEVLSLGNPVIWWAGLLAIFHQVWRWAAARDWRSGALLCGYMAGWLPWLIYHNRTIFTFYAIVQVPFLVAMLAMSLASLPGTASATPARRFWGFLAAGAVVVLAVAAAWWFYPIWTGQVLPYGHWHLRMWLPTWV